MALEGLGYDPMPWQKQVANTALEVDENGNYVYREVVLIVPRQAGKTSLLLGVLVQRSLCMGRPQNAFYTAQTHKDAYKKFRDDQLETLINSPFKEMFLPRLGTGHEGLKWENGSIYRIGAPTKDAGHGQTLDLGMIDEAFALVDDRLEQGLKPTMVTRKNAQIWIVSAAGDETSAYLIGKRDLGRERASLGQDTGSCYFEWSNESDDPSDPETWKSCHPALGHTIDEQVLKADFASMPIAEFERAYLARWPGHRHSRVISEEDWEACHDSDSRVQGTVTFGIDVSPDRSVTSISAATTYSDGLTHVQVLERKAGVDWVIPVIQGYLDRNPGSKVALDSGSSAGSLIPLMEVLGMIPRMHMLKMRDFTRACGTFYDLVIEHKLRHQANPILDESVATAKKRLLGDSWAWDRKSGNDATPITSATIAVFSHIAQVPTKEFEWSSY